MKRFILKCCIILHYWIVISTLFSCHIIVRPYCLRVVVLSSCCCLAKLRYNVKTKIISVALLLHSDFDEGGVRRQSTSSGGVVFGVP